MKKIYLILISIVFFGTTLFFVRKAFTQQINAGQVAGATLDQRIRNAAANCQAMFPCVIYLPPETGVLPKGTITCNAYPTLFDPAGISGCGQTITLKTMNGIRFADGFSGTDCGAKINAADSDIGGSSGEIWVNQNCGTNWTTAVTLTNSHVLKFIQGGTYLTSAMITLSGPSNGILGTGGAMWTGVVGPTTIIKEANAANLPAVIKMIGGTNGGNWLHDIAIDANKANQTCPSPPCYGVWNFRSIRPEIRGVSIQNAPNEGLMVESGAWPANDSCCASLLDNMILNNTGSALKVVASSDLQATHNQFENSNIGAELIDAPNKRFINNDFGGNTLNGIKVTCTVVGAGSGSIISSNQFGNNLADDISINAWTGTAQCAPGTGTTIVLNEFVSGAGRTANTFDAIKIQNSQFNLIASNNVILPPGATSFKYALEILAPNIAEGRDMVVGNSFQGWATAAINPQTSTYAIGNSGSNSTILDGSLSVSNGLLLGGGTSLNTYRRISVSLSPALVAANTCAAQSFTVTGLAAADILVSVTKPTEQAGLSVSNGHVTGINAATINFCNNTALGITPTAAETYQFTAVQ